MVREHAAVPLVDLNTTPLIDVMLVLLIIFMIAAPMMAHRIKLPGPSADPAPSAQTRHEIGIESIGADVRLWLDGVLVSRSELAGALRDAGRLPLARQPEFRIEPAADVRFESVAELLAQGQRAGVGRIGVSGGY